MPEKKTLAIYDTTLRDGNQGVGINLSVSDKVRIAERLSELGVPFIEGGWPNPTNETDNEFFSQIKKRKLTAKVAAFGSTRRPGNSCAKDELIQSLIKAETPVITIFGKSWDLHVNHVLKTSEQENLDMIAESVAYLKKHVEKVFYDAEHFFDGFRGNRAYALKTIEAARQAGADCIVLCDTNGGMLPDKFLEIFRETKETFTAVSAFICITTPDAPRPIRFSASSKEPFRSRAPSTATVSAPVTAIW
jgi:2-isopropylmalate synthase